MMNRVRKIAVTTGVLAVAALVSGARAASVSGTVTYEGKVPALKPVAMDADPACARKHASAPASEALVLGDGNTMGNIVVRVVKGLPAGKTYPVPKTPVVLDQEGCRYKPHVIGMMTGQEFKILNSDGILHNVHALPKVNKQFNMAMPATRKEATATFDKEEGMFQIKCDVHPWMVAYVLVSSHPYFAVTGKDGKFSIPNLEAGTYEIEAWHEKLGTQKSTVTLAASDNKTVPFKFSAPAK
jgi:plastocyanin